MNPSTRWVLGMAYRIAWSCKARESAEELQSAERVPGKDLFEGMCPRIQTEGWDM